MAISIYFSIFLRHYFASSLRPCKVKQIKINKQTECTKCIWDYLCSLKITSRSGCPVQSQQFRSGKPRTLRCKGISQPQPGSISTFSGAQGGWWDTLTTATCCTTCTAKGLVDWGFRFGPRQITHSSLLVMRTPTGAQKRRSMPSEATPVAHCHQIKISSNEIVWRKCLNMLQMIETSLLLFLFLNFVRKKWSTS